MNKYIDLHTHSSVSDGTFSPTELANEAKRVGLRAIALTDHDTTDGIADFTKTCEKNGIEGIPGVEISTSWYSSSLHIVGLFIDPDNGVLNKLLSEIRENRDLRNRKMVSKLNKLDYRITLEELIEESGDEKVIGRPHFAAILIRKGYFETPSEVFNELLGDRKKGFVPRYLPMPGVGISAIHAAGGLAIWAHPYSMQNVPCSVTRKTCKTLIKHKLDGIECYYTSFSDKDRENAMTMVRDYNLLVSGGSDFHGKNTPDVVLGLGNKKFETLRIPYSLVENMKRKLQI
ncbi:MAG: PHP domain-containing protein [Verrucomicrobiota bacterium]|nr:PHP domain-containing protein [Verrucomicrobiota bacterium]